MNDASYPIDTVGEDGIAYSMMLHTKKQKNRECIAFLFDTTVQVENLLVSDLTISFDQKGNRRTIVVKSGETKDAYAAYKSKLEALELKAQGLIYKNVKKGDGIEAMVRDAMARWDKQAGRSGSSSPTGAMEESKQQEVGVKDRAEFEFIDPKTKAKLCVIGELSSTPIRGAVTLTFYVPYWIYDLTQYNLIPSQDKLKDSSPAGRLAKVYGDTKKGMDVEP